MTKRKSKPELPPQGCETTQCNSRNVCVGKQLDIGAPVRVSRLDSLAACRAELGKLYREARKRAGRYPEPLEAKRLADVLGAIRSAIELDDFERRLEILEIHAAKRGNPSSN